MPVIQIVVVIVAVLSSVAAIIIGWPEQTPTQRVLLELGALPLQAAVGVVLWRLGSGIRPTSKRRRVLLGCGLVWALGLLGVGIGYLGAHWLVNFGQAVSWIGIGAALIALLSWWPRRPARGTSFIRLAEEEPADSLWLGEVDPDTPGRSPASPAASN